MAYSVTISSNARKALRDIPQDIQSRITMAIDGLVDNPRPPGAIATKGIWEGHFRIREGNYRIIYQVSDEKLLVLVVRVSDRKDVYR